MKIITAPRVTVISSMLFHDHPEYDIPITDDDGVSIGGFAAKGCYDSYGADGRSCEENQLQVIEQKHGSVLEHIHVGMFIEGITRGLTLELNRHRTFNISQRSTRYTAEEDSAFVLEPYFAHLWEKYNLEWDDDFGAVRCNSNLRMNQMNFNEINLVRDHVNAMVKSAHAYERQVEKLMELNPLSLNGFTLRKWARGKARNVLSHGLETRGTWTNNLRGWRWVIEQRSSKHAEPEIRRLSDHLFHKLNELHPLYFQDFEMVSVYDDIPEWAPKYSKV